MKLAEKIVISSGIAGLIYGIIAMILEVKCISFKIELSWVLTYLAFLELVKMLLHIKDV